MEDVVYDGASDQEQYIKGKCWRVCIGRIVLTMKHEQVSVAATTIHCITDKDLSILASNVIGARTLLIACEGVDHAGDHVSMGAMVSIRN